MRPDGGRLDPSRLPTLEREGVARGQRHQASQVGEVEGGQDARYGAVQGHAVIEQERAASGHLKSGAAEYGRMVRGAGATWSKSESRERWRAAERGAGGLPGGHRT